jgi:hypothetical protein
MSKKFSFTRSLLTVFMALVLTFTLIACGNNNQELADEAADSVAIIFASGDNANSVTQNLNLPTTVGEVAITWSSNNTSVIANNGTVTRGFNDVTVVLTATATVGDATGSKQFTLIVKGHDVQAALNAINITGALTYNATTQIYTVNGNITLPTTANGLAVTWESTIPAVISATGAVVRPAYGQPNANVTLIASINNVEREFNMVVPAITEKPASLILQEASDALLLSGVSDGVSANLSLPSVVGTEGVTVTWSSSNTAVISNTGVVVRGENNVTIILTATLTLGTASVTKEFEVVVLAATSYVVVSNIAEAIEIAQNPVTGNVVSTYVQINNVTVLGITGDGLVIMDESGYLFMYIPTASNKVTQTGEPVVKNGVYTVRGIATRFNNTWQLSFSASEPIMFFASEEAPYVPTPIVAENVSAMLANHVVPSTENPNFVIQYYRLTAKVRVQNPTDNYGTVFVNPDYTGPDIPTAANSAHTMDGVVVYYHSNKAAFNNLHDQVVTFNLIMYGYRNDRYVFYSLFLGTIDDIQTSLDDAGTVNLVESTLIGQTPKAFTEAGTVSLPTSLLGATIVWTSSNQTLINSTTGAVTLPAEGQVEVTLTATITKGEASKVATIKINVGQLELTTIANALTKAAGTKVWIEGTVTYFIYSSSFSNAAVFIQDDTAGIFLFRLAGTGVQNIKVGDKIKVIGVRTAFNGLEQLASPWEGVEILSSGNAFVAEKVEATDDFATFKSEYVYFTGTLKAKVTISTTAASNAAIIVVGDKEVQINVPHPGDYADVAVRNALIAVLEGMEAGDTFSVFGPLGWNNGPRIMVFTAADIVVGGYVELDDAGKAEQAAGLIQIPEERETATAITLPTTGAHGSTITWTSSNAAIINPETGAVVLPETGNVVVTLTATVVVGTAEFVKTFDVTVGEIVRTVAYARAAANTTIVTIEGLITSIAFDGSDRAVFFLEDNTAGIYVYKVAASFKDSLVVGNRVKIVGARGEFGLSPQIINITAVTVLETGVAVTPTVITSPTQLVENQGKHVSVTGYLRQDYTGTPSDFHLVTTAGTYNLRLVSGSDQNADLRTAVQTLLVAAEVGAQVTVLGGAQRNNAVYQVMLFQASLVTVGAVGSEAELGAVAAALFVKPAANAEVVANLTLPAAGLFGSVVTWTSSDPEVITNAGVVTRPVFEDGDAAVVMTYSLKIGATEYGTGTVEYTVLKADKVIVDYALPEYRAFANTWDGSAANIVGREGELILTATAINVWEGWQIQVIQDATAISGAADNTGHMQLVAGKSYRVMFDAYASVAGNIKLAIGHSTAWVPYYEQAGIAVTTEKQTFTIDFTLSAEGTFTTPAQFKLELGTLFAGKTAPQWFALDNVVIKELVGEAYVATELILNGTMDEAVVVVPEPVVFYSTGFEDVATGTSYTRNEFTTNTKNWTAAGLRISDNNNFTGWRGTGSIAAALRNGASYMQTEFTVTNLFGISFNGAKYGSDSNTSYKVQVSLDKTTWIDITLSIEVTDTLVERTHEIDYSSSALVDAGITASTPLYIRIQHTGGGSGSTNYRVMIDDIKIWNFPTE